MCCLKTDKYNTNVGSVGWIQICLFDISYKFGFYIDYFGFVISKKLFNPEYFL